MFAVVLAIPVRLITILSLFAAVVEAQSAPIASMGQPRRLQPYVVPMLQCNGPVECDPRLAVGFHRAVTNPVTGLFGVTGEVVLRNEPSFGAGARLMATSRALGLSAGVDWNGQNTFEPIFSWQTAIRRGGIVGGGTMIRFDLMPHGEEEGSIGIHIPLWQPRAGRTRRKDTDVDEPIGPDRRAVPQLPLSVPAERAMQEAAQSASMILAYTNLFSEDTARVRYGESFTQAMRSYAAALARAFAVATDSAAGAMLTERARRGLLDLVILPYDSLFGQVKAHPGSIRGLTSTAHTRFVAWMRDSTQLPPAAQASAAGVHARLIAIIEGAHATLLEQWHDSRLVWLPLQLALTEDQYDEQAEVDALLERAVGRPFTDGNALTYLRSSDLPLEIARSIFAARDYHVLWTHDFTGQRDETKEVDEMAFTMVADVYLPALTAAVQRYDSIGKLPAYMIFIDAFFYAQRNGRLWMSILENPLEADMNLPGAKAEWEARLRERQRALRAAVAASRTLPAGAAKVHVNVLNPADFSFRSHRIVPPWPFVPDNIMRDHRKLVFYDVNEVDPYRGALMIMGVGIGEHYATATWEDRGYRVRGPAALEARRALRRVWVSQGMRAADLPVPLHDLSASVPADSVRTYEYVGRAMQVHNEAGFGQKQSSIARAMQYNLAPAGSVIIVPDPIWVSATWASMLSGAAARGAKVFVIAPSSENNPNPQAPIAAAERFVMERLLAIRSRLADQLRASGGELRVGIYASTTQVTDVAARIAEVREGLRKAPWIRDVIPFDDATLATLDRAVVRTESEGSNASGIATDAKPRAPMLHQKTQLIARPGAIGTLVRQPGWENVLLQSMQIQSTQTAKFADQLGYVTPEIDSAAVRGADARMRGYEQALSASERKAFSFYFSVGTQNMDPRGILLDGEATLVVSGLQAAVGLADLYYLMARSTWITEQRELDALIPPAGWFTRWLARQLRYAL